MKYCLPVLCVIALIVAVYPNTLYSANHITQILPFAPFDDDPAVYNNCKYCHGPHNARKDVHGLLNEKEERYSRYLNSRALSGGGENSVFSEGNSRKCPRSRIKNSQ